MRPVLVFLVVVILSSCSGNDEKSKSLQDEVEPADQESTVMSDIGTSANWDALSEKLIDSPDLDLNMNIDSLGLWQLRVLRNVIPARQGFLFMESDLRAWFDQTKWYKKEMEDRWYGDCKESGKKKKSPITYSSEETAFMDRCKAKEDALLKENLIERDGRKLANLNNIVNLWQFNGLPAGIADKLAENQFVILPSQNVQFFNVYEQNDYSQTQNFITTDMAMHLGHIHTSFLVRDLEEEYLSDLISTFLMMSHAEMEKLKKQFPEAKADFEFIEAFNAVAIALQGGDWKKYCPMSMQSKVEMEIKLLNKAEDATSALMPAYQSVSFPYSMFKPRGHYTRSDVLKNYFKAVNWLQWGSFCLTDQEDLTKASINAFVLRNAEVRKLYNEFMELTTFFFGEPDNLSMAELEGVLSRNNVISVSEITAKFEVIQKAALELSKKKNAITPKVARGCVDKVNIMPARYMFDNEVLQEMTWIEQGQGTKRPFAKGLDVFASLGDALAEEILLKEYQEDKNWKDFVPNLKKMQKKFKDFKNWDATVYNKTMQIIKVNLTQDKRAPAFMQHHTWKRKNLNTSLATWAQLKHDAVLYAEQPFAAECGGGGECDPPPDPIVRGYVEPNTEVYLHLIEMLTKTQQLTDKVGALSHWKYHTNELKDFYTFLLDVSRKELEGRALKDEEHRKIEIMGSTVEWMTLQMMGVYEWDAVKGADREVALVADIYTNNEDKKKSGILHVACGFVNDLYVVVEINGCLYLTRGGVHSYYEFVQPLDSRLTDEEWQEKLRSKAAPAVPNWMESIMLKGVLAPKVKEVVYSSGC